MSKKKIAIIGAGFGGLTAAAMLAKEGHDVHVFEKNDQPGGRAQVRNIEGFTFDMGPSWYMMPEIFEEVFEILDRKLENYYELERLTPTYKAFFDDLAVNIYSDLEKNKETFEKIEKGSFEKLMKIMKHAEFFYTDSAKKFLYKDFESITDFLDFPFILRFLKNQFFVSYEKYMNKNFSSKKMKDILSWHTVFVGGNPKNVPSVFVLMLYVDFIIGTYYPKGGMSKPVLAIEIIAKEYGAIFNYNSPVEKMNVVDSKVKSIVVKGRNIEFDLVVSNADYKFSEELMEEEYRQYSKKYWESREMSPSTFLLFLGLNKKLKNLEHHNYYFSKDSDEHFDSMTMGKYRWPKNPSLYISCPSKSDPTIAPKDCENLMILVPIAPGIEDSDEMREKLEQQLIKRLEEISGEKIEENILVKFNYGIKDFELDYNAYKGNAFGMANTLLQTGSFRTKNKSKKVKNLYFTGTTTLPGIGVPLALISGQMTSKKIIEDFQNGR